MDTIPDNQDIAREAKALVGLAFRNGPIEDVHAGRSCPTCDGQPGLSRITDTEMKEIMKSAVDQLYRLLRMKTEDPSMYESEVRRGAAYTAAWDKPSGVFDPQPDKAAEFRPRLAGGGVLVSIPLESWGSSPKHPKQSYSLDRRRSRLEKILSYVGFTIQHEGMASAYECKTERDSLSLLLAVSDSTATVAELQSYLSVLALPTGSRIRIFKDDSHGTQEIDLDL